MRGGVVPGPQRRGVMPGAAQVLLDESSLELRKGLLDGMYVLGISHIASILAHVSNDWPKALARHGDQADLKVGLSVPVGSME